MNFKGYVLPPHVKYFDRKFSNELDCLHAAIFMASCVDDEEKTQNYREHLQIQEAYLRASIGELVRFHDLVKTTQLSFYKYSDLTHFLILLRNFNMHLHASELESGSTLIEYAGQQCRYQSVVVCNLSDVCFESLDSARRSCDKEKFLRLRDNFESYQRNLGIVQLLYYICDNLSDSFYRVYAKI